MTNMYVIDLIPEGAIIWSGRNSMNTENTSIQWMGRKHKNQVRSEQKAIKYLRALGVPESMGSVYPWSHCVTLPGEQLPLDPLVKKLYDRIDNPDNETGLLFLRSLRELEDITQ